MAKQECFKTALLAEAILLCGILWLGLAACSGTEAGAGDPEDPAWPFRDFLEQQPDVSYIEFFEDARRWLGLEEKERKGFFYFEGAKQGRTFYVRELGYNRTAAGHLRAADVFGRTDEGFGWSMGSNIVHLETSQRNVPPLTSGPQNASDVYEYRLQMAMALGIDHLRNGTLRWVDSSNFVAESRFGGQIAGQVMAYTNGRPRRVEYTVSNLETRRFAVEYQYEGDAVPDGIPSLWSRSVRRENSAAEWKPLFTEGITALVAGRRQLPDKGYTPAMFLEGGGTTALAVFIHTNGATYGVYPDGRLERADYNPTMAGSFLERRPKLRAGIVIAAVVLANAAFFLWWRTSRPPGSGGEHRDKHSENLNRDL